jgi:adenylate kinase family enzyme
VYFDQTLPVIEYYRGQGILDEVDGNRPIEKVRAATLSAVDERRRRIG